MEIATEQEDKITVERLFEKYKKKQYPTAKKIAKKLLAKDPNYPQALEVMADICAQEEKYPESMEYFLTLSKNSLYTLESLKKIRFILHKYPATAEFEKFFIKILDYKILANNLLALPILTYFVKLGLNEEITHNELFKLAIKRLIIPYTQLEILLLNERKKNTHYLKNRDDKFNMGLTLSIAHNAFLNEYIWIQDQSDINSVILMLKECSEECAATNSFNYYHKACVALACCYISMPALLAYYPNLEQFIVQENDLIELYNFQVRNTVIENQIKETIPKITTIDGHVSKAIQAQYEEYPYPRWLYIEYTNNFPFSVYLDRKMPTLIDEPGLRPEKPEILIAGCGTGSHPIPVSQVKQANITAIDLSLSSMAYAKRQSDDIGIKNIHYFQADISKLKEYKKKFDYIESAGVLHHMQDVEQALGFLVEKLKTNGFMNLALYSKIGREQLSVTRNHLKEKGFTSSIDDIRKARIYMMNNAHVNEFNYSINYTDFFSTSMFIDLLFNANEHELTIPKLKKMFKKYKLKFCGFAFSDNQKVFFEKYQEDYPNDPKGLNLDNWNEFENKNRAVFKNMYQFIVKKT